MVRKSYYVVGGSDGEDRKTNWEPKVNKDPFYRTMDIFNGVFKKNIKLSAGESNCTDLHTIKINFGELKPSKIAKILGPGYDKDHSIFLLECDHEWEGRSTKDGAPKSIGDWGMCGVCGADTIYRGFEHEWQHIIFKSDLAARAVFCDRYSEQLQKQLSTNYPIDEIELSNFLHLLVNAFDDIRVNSLWEKVYPGSAMAIWDRWRLYTTLMNNKNTSFLAYIFAVAFDVPTNPQGEFEPMKPVIQWALSQVRYRGFNNMLLIVRVVMDRCMGALLAKMKPTNKASPQPPPAPSLKLPVSLPDGQSNNSQEDKDEKENNSQDVQFNGGREKESETKIGSGQEGQCDSQTETNPTKDQESHAPDTDQYDGTGWRLQQLGVPSLNDVKADDTEKTQALARLMGDPQQLDPKEEHSPPTAEDLSIAQNSLALRAAFNKILHQDISKPEELGTEQSGEPDLEMQAQIDQLQGGVVQKSEASQLTDGSRAKVTIINVTSDGIGEDRLQLESSEKTIIQRLRGAFLRSMGKQKAKRSSAGTSIDVETLIQYLSDFQDSDVFNSDDVNQGFAYSVVCDMSGSMTGSFPVVCRATEMLKQALDFPFVVGNLWGFRGGQPIRPSSPTKKDLFNGGEVWMYKYDKDVDWYTGTVPVRLFPGPNGVFQVPVKCGGITPMNSAINIATAHLWRKMPAGMAKRMFLLTDGSPLQVKVTGKHIPEFILRQFVASEITKARKHGIEVYTLVIGEHAIEEDKCLQMFGQKKFWMRVGRERVGTVLLSLVLKNFTKYLRRR